MGIGHLFIVHCEGTYGDFGDRVDGASRMIAWAQKLTDEDLQGKVSPSIIMFNEDIEHWDNRHTVIYVPVNRKDHPLDNKVADSFIDD